MPFERLFMLSALSGDGVADLKAYLAARVPAGPWHYPADDLTDIPLRTLAAEITREKIYNRVHDELPYASTVETTSWQERKDGSVRIEQTIFVARDGQKAIMLGKGGQTIKQISTDSPQRAVRDPRAPGAPVPVRQGARGLAGRSRALPGDGP